MIRIEIKSSTPNERSGTKNGKDWLIRTQPAYALIPDENGELPPYPESIEVDLKRDQAPYALGVYTLHPASFFVGDFKKLSIGRLILVKTPVASTQPAPLSKAA